MRKKKIIIITSSSSGRIPYIEKSGFDSQPSCYFCLVVSTMIQSIKSIHAEFIAKREPKKIFVFIIIVLCSTIKTKRNSWPIILSNPDLRDDKQTIFQIQPHWLTSQVFHFNINLQYIMFEDTFKKF